MRGCIVPFCHNKGTISGVRYFRITESRRDWWLLALGRSLSDTISKDSSICSKHFRPEDFHLVNGKNVLISTAIPSLHLKPTRRELLGQLPESQVKIEVKEEVIYDEISSSSKMQLPGQLTLLFTGKEHSKEINKIPLSIEETRSTSFQEETVQTGLKPLYAESTECSSSDSSATSTYFSNVRKRPHSLMESSSDGEGLEGNLMLIKEMHNYNKSPQKLSEIVSDLQQSNKKLKMIVKNEKACSKRLRRKVNNLKDVVTNLRKRPYISINAKEILENHFSGVTQALMKRILQKSTNEKMGGGEYPEELKKFAMTLHFHSTEAYNYVRETFNSALPSPATITKWRTECKNEFTKQSFESLKLQVQKDKENEPKIISDDLMS